MKSGGTVLGDLAQGFGQRGGIKPVLRAPVIAGTRRIAVSEQERGRGRNLPDVLQPLDDREDKVPCDVESGVGDLDRRSDELRPWQPGGRSVSLPEPCDGARDGDRQGASLVAPAFD